MIIVTAAKAGPGSQASLGYDPDWRPRRDPDSDFSSWGASCTGHAHWGRAKRRDYCIVLKDTYTIFCITRYITIYIVDWYSNITKNIRKQICYITTNIRKVNTIHQHNTLNLNSGPKFKFNDSCCVVWPWQLTWTQIQWWLFRLGHWIWMTTGLKCMIGLDSGQGLDYE